MLTVRRDPRAFLTGSFVGFFPDDKLSAPPTGFFLWLFVSHPESILSLVGIWLLPEYKESSSLVSFGTVVRCLSDPNALLHIQEYRLKAILKYAWPCFVEQPRMNAPRRRYIWMSLNHMSRSTSLNLDWENFFPEDIE